MWTLRICAGFVAALAMSQAFAADLRPALVRKAPAYAAPAAPSWSGCYLGLHAGSAWSKQSAYTDPAIAAGLNQAAVDAPLSEASSALGGGHLGCNWQVAPAVVFGIEGDISALSLRANARGENRDLVGTLFPGEVTFRRDNDWLATARGRIGFLATPAALLYATGGAAFTTSRYSATDVFNTGCPNCGIANFEDTRTGWVAGGGVEVALGNKWSVRGEYLYHRFGGASATAFFQSFPAIPAAGLNFRDLEIHTARIGVSYRFGG